MKYGWEVKDKFKETSSLKWSILKSVPGYLNITKKCLLCLNERLEIINYPKQEVLLKQAVRIDFKMPPWLTSTYFQITKVRIS